MAYDNDHQAIADAKKMHWYRDDNFTADLSREFIRWNPTRRAATLKDMADITAANDGQSLKKKAQLMNLRRQLARSA